MDIMYLVHKFIVSCKVHRLVFKLTTLSRVEKQIHFIFMYHSEFLGSRNYRIFRPIARVIYTKKI
jgi:hypothetical protein